MGYEYLRSRSVYIYSGAARLGPAPVSAAAAPVGETKVQVVAPLVVLSRSSISALRAPLKQLVLFQRQIQ